MWWVFPEQLEEDLFDTEQNMSVKFWTYSKKSMAI